MDSPISGPVEARSSGLSVNTTGLDDISEPSPVSLVESQPNGDAHSPPVRRRQDGYFWMSVAEANSRSRRLPKGFLLEPSVPEHIAPLCASTDRRPKREKRKNMMLTDYDSIAKRGRTDSDDKDYRKQELLSRLQQLNQNIAQINDLQFNPYSTPKPSRNAYPPYSPATPHTPYTPTDFPLPRATSSTVKRSKRQATRRDSDSSYIVRTNGHGSTKTSTKSISHGNRQMQFCQNILRRLRNMREAENFNAPVHVLWPTIHETGYFNVITKPMDFETIDGKLKDGEYLSPSEFAADCRLVWSNSQKFNPPGEPLHEFSLKLEKFFEDQWRKLPDPDPDCDPVAKNFNDMQKKYNQLLRRVKEMEKKQVAPRAKEETVRPMTFEEKKELSNNINELPQEKLEGVVEIIQKSMPKLMNTQSDEIELDIDKLDNKTLRHLERFVNRALGKKKKRVSEVKKAKRTESEAKQREAELKRRIAEIEALEAEEGNIGMDQPGAAGGASAVDEDSDSDSLSDSDY
eukprot:Rmarinus@m.12202